MVLFGFFSLVLVLVYWVNRAVILFDELISDGQSAAVFLEFTVLSLPNVIRLALPLAAFAAAVYVTNRLSRESELTVAQATGLSPMRLARPVALFGLIVALIVSAIVHLLLPASVTAQKESEAEIAQNISARLLTEGTFLHPADGITFYIRDISPEGELRDIFLSDRRDPENPVTYTAARAYLVRAPEGPRLVMLQGSAQALELPANRLFLTSFADFTYDIGALIEPPDRGRLSVRELGTWDAIFPDAQVLEDTQASLGRILQEGHGRFSQALLCVVAALLGFAPLLAGGFSRFGAGRQIVLAVFLLIPVKFVESAAIDVVRREPEAWPLIYLPVVAGLAMAWALLWFSGRRRLRSGARSVPA